MAQSYAQSHKSSSEKKSDSGSSHAGIIKQERKGNVKSEADGDHVKMEDVAQEESKQEGSMYDYMFQTVAAGLVADELPRDLVAKFLEALEESESSVYIGMATEKS